MKITFALLAVVAIAATGLHCGPATPEPSVPEGAAAAPSAPSTPAADVDAAAPEQPK